MTAPIATFELKDRSQLTLHGNRIVHEGGGTLEIVPLAQLASVRVAFERDERKLNWAIGLLVAALFLALLSGPVQNWSAAGVASLASQPRDDSIRAVLLVTLSAAGAFARFLPKAAWALGAVAAVLGVFFYLGRTTLTLSFASVERVFEVRGRSQQLTEFTEVIGEHLAMRLK